ncbi:potassium transporter TrkA [Boudabousia liubingyangii]|uniref:Trk system potassium uptake protein TrkA n=1 Tax=Boudabousia liubingyangii TaxID=1921764 RepID=A0A1Q5PJD1_9ACTO|nr:TrkA family potassium uptake protein [Boudabousia liubingyangii]OKL45986.1 potassium transporter TrkA [Boudabousia liubingyangii]OKL47737.1 potassium transporter TrkA [Boudabousia liubingyangii]
MHFVIMGAGRVGASLAVQLDSMGHSVAVIDQDADAFRRLPSDFGGRRVTGLGFDRDSLRQAGIEDAYAFAAVSNGDNSNVIAARVVRETFGVKRVVARIYDPKRAKVYQRLGIPTVGTVRYTSTEMLRRMLPNVTDVVYADDNSQLQIVHEVVSEEWAGKKLKTFEDEYRTRVVYVRRQGQTLLANDALAFVENDEVFFAVAKEDRVLAVKALQRPPLPEEVNK